MTSRIHAPHTTCPSCKEEVYLDELVGGRCPLCGCSLENGEEVDSEFDELIGRSDLSWMVFHYFFFRKLDRLGAHPVQIMHLISRYEEQITSGEAATRDIPFDLEISMRLLDIIRPKRCSVCGKLFLRSGKKYVSGLLRSPSQIVRFTCRACSKTSGAQE
jgi:hypothetical protein